MIMRIPTACCTLGQMQVKNSDPINEIQKFIDTAKIESEKLYD